MYLNLSESDSEKKSDGSCKSHDYSGILGDSIQGCLQKECQR